MDFRFGPEDLHLMRILVVEDEYLLAADLAEAFEARGAVVIGPVATVDEAMLAVATNWIDRAVLDVNLDGEMSFEIADRLERAGIPYVLATAYRAEQLPERFRGKPRLEKPYGLAALAGMMAV
jgi:DNA-binding response OmpR family regulator